MARSRLFILHVLHSRHYLNPGFAMANAAINKKRQSGIGLKFKERTSKMLHLEHSMVWCWNVDTKTKLRGLSPRANYTDTSENISEIPGNF